MEKKSTPNPAIFKEIQEIFEIINKGSENALSVDLFPIFQKFKRAINMSNLDVSSSTFSKLCSIIETKFNELQMFLALFGQEKKFLTYLESNPSNIEISNLLKSKNFLENRRREGYTIENLQIPNKNENFVLEMRSISFQETIENYYNEIYRKLPCNIEDLFEELESQEEIYEKFFIILHLLQSGKIMYQKQTNFVYIPEGGKYE